MSIAANVLDLSICSIITFMDFYSRPVSTFDVPPSLFCYFTCNSILEWLTGFSSIIEWDSILILYSCVILCILDHCISFQFHILFIPPSIVFVSFEFYSLEIYVCLCDIKVCNFLTIVCLYFASFCYICFK